MELKVAKTIVIKMCRLPSKPKPRCALRLSYVVVFFSICFSAHSQQLKIEVKSVRNEGGHISLALYNSESTFMKTVFQSKTVKATKGNVEIVFENIPSGSYAISVLHDANQNSKLDTGSFGIPKEGFGFSNDALGMFGPPKFEKAKFEFSGREQIQISLRYMNGQWKKEKAP